MKWQSIIILFFIFINLATGLVVELQVPGIEYVTPGRNPTNASEHAENFNATQIAEGWTFPPSLGVPMFGDIWSGFSFLVRMITYTIVGFPVFLGWLGDSFITDPSALVTWGYITATLVACFSVVMALYFIWFISGRDV